MTYKGLVLGFSALSTLMLAGCASAVLGGSQKVDVVVKGSPTAYCDFYNERFRNSGHFPNTATFERSREPLIADCTGEQGRRVKFTIQPISNEEGTVGNVPTGVIPGLGYDAMTGAMWSWPDPVIVDFRKIPDGEKPAWPSEASVESKDRAAYLNQLSGEATSPAMDLNPTVPPRETAKPVVIDAAVLAVEGDPMAVPAARQPIAKVHVAPIVSPEDHMGLHPAEVKAKEEAKRKAAAEAKEKAAAAKREAEKETKRLAEVKKAQEAEAKAAAARAEAAATETTSGSRFDAPTHVVDPNYDNASDLPPAVEHENPIIIEQPITITNEAPPAALADEMQQNAADAPPLSAPIQSGPQGGLVLDDGSVSN